MELDKEKVKKVCEGYIRAVGGEAHMIDVNEVDRTARNIIERIEKSEAETDDD